jgi:hypothetical protein
MSTATILLPKAPARLITAVLAFTLLIASAPAARAQEEELLPPKKLDRQFPQGQFCAIKVSLPFTANSNSARIVFEAKRFVPDFNNTLLWTEQYIDNVAIATAADYAANFGPPPAGSQPQNCYIGDPTPTPYFYLNRAGLSLPLKELFDVDPAGTGWDLAHGAYWRSDYSAPRDPEHDAEYAGGSLGLGQDSPTPSITDVASTQISLTNLVPGQAYDLSAWWSVGQVVFGSTYEYLTISVFGPGSTPLVRRSWGAVKASYK